MQETINLPKRFWEDDTWTHEHYMDLQHKYKDKWVAVFNKEVISVADGPETARKEAQKKIGVKEISVIFVEDDLRIY